MSEVMKNTKIVEVTILLSIADCGCDDEWNIEFEGNSRAAART